MLKKTLLLPRLVALALLLAAAGAQAVPPLRHQHRGHAGPHSLREVIAEVEHQYRGHVVDVQAPSANDNEYRLRVLQRNGRVRTVRIPAARVRHRN